MSSFRRNTMLAAAGNFSTTFALAVALIVIARFGSSELVGRYSLALAICTPLFLLAHLRLRDIRGTESDDGFVLRDYFEVSFAANAAATILVGPACWLAGFDRETILVTVLMGLWKSTIGFSDVVYGTHQSKASMGIVARSQILHSVVTSIAFASVFIATRSLVWSMAVLFPVNLLLFLLVDLPTLRTEQTDGPVRSRTDRRTRAWRLAASSAPLGFAGAVFALTMIIPRMQLEHWYSLAEVGVFSALAFFARAGTPFVQAFGQAASPRLSSMVSSGNGTEFGRLLVQAAMVPLIFGIVSMGLGWLIGQQVLEWVYGPEFVTSKTAIVLIAMYATLIYLCTVWTYGAIAARRLKSQLVVLAMTVASVWISGLWLIPRMGIEGACLSLVISATVRVAGTVAINVLAARVIDRAAEAALTSREVQKSA